MNEQHPTLNSAAIESLTSDLVAALSALPEEERIEALNRVRQELHAVSPFRDEPVDCVLWLRQEEVLANDYNPNSVAPPEMRLLAHSIREDGYTQPVVAFSPGAMNVVVNSDTAPVETVDGFHRGEIGRKDKTIRERVRGRLPVTLVRAKQGGLRDRMASTIRHNRARGVHGVLPMGDIVARLIREGWNDEEIAKNLGMDADEVLRFKQTIGLPELFAKNGYSRAWE